MRLYQSNFEYNSITASLGHIFLYSVLFIIPTDGQNHPSTGLMAILFIGTLTIIKLYFIYFNRDKNYERVIAFALIEASAMFWTYLYVSEIMLSPALNHFIIIVFLSLTGVAYTGAFVLYKNQPLHSAFSSTLLLLSALLTPFYLDELKIPFILVLLLSFVINVIYSKVHHSNWQKFLVQKERSENVSQELIKTNQKLNDAVKEAELATQIKGDFIATVSHEIRTPINGVLGMSSLLQETDLNEEQKEIVGMVVSSADSLLTIINDILDFSKLESGKLRIENVSFDLSEMLNEIAVLFGEMSSGKGLKFSLVLPNELENNIIGDPVRLRQILTNIIGNALKFTLEGYIKLSLKFKLLNNDVQMVQFKIEDTGIGIEEEKLKLIFNRFTQADSSTTRKFGGTGLGLAITKELVGLMSGHLDVKSKPGIGTIFYVNIPFKLDRIKITKDADPDSCEDLLTLKKLTEGKKILIVEDNPINQKVTLLMLKKTHCATEAS